MRGRRSLRIRGSMGSLFVMRGDIRGGARWLLCGVSGERVS